MCIQPHIVQHVCNEALAIKSPPLRGMSESVRRVKTLQTSAEAAEQVQEVKAEHEHGGGGV